MIELRAGDQDAAAAPEGEHPRVQPVGSCRRRLLDDGALAVEGGRRVEDLERLVLHSAGRHVAEAAAMIVRPSGSNVCVGYHRPFAMEGC